MEEVIKNEVLWKYFFTSVKYNDFKIIKDFYYLSKIVF